MADLSPAAQAVLDGFRAVPSLMDGPSIAGALRAAADQGTYPDENGVDWILADVLLGIAAELEGNND